MANTHRTDPDAGPVETEGQEAYPTYHDRPDSAGTVGGMRPTDATLPPSRRTYGTPMLLGVLAFAVLLVAIIAIASMNMASVSDETASPTETSIGEPMTGTGAAPGSLDRDVGATVAPPSGAVSEAPSGADVPGGDSGTSQPAAPAAGQ